MHKKGIQLNYGGWGWDGTMVGVIVNVVLKNKIEKYDALII